MRKALLGVTVIVASFLFLCGLFLFGGQIKQKLTMWNTERHLDEATVRYKRLMKNIPITDDTLLIDTLRGIEVEAAYPDCVRDAGYQIFGSNHAFQELTKQYRDKYDQMGWIYGGTGTSGLRLNYHNPENTIAISIFPPAEEQFQTTVSESQLSQWLSQFQTIYEITIFYAEPRVDGCFL